MMTLAVCEKRKNPVQYTKTTCDEFLRYVSYCKREEVEAEVEKLNTEHPEKDCFGAKIDWENIAYFFINEQEEFEG